MVRRETIYTDFDGNERKETFYFNLTEAEILQMEFETSGGLANKLQSIMDKKDAVEVMKTFRWLIDVSYGVKSPDGRTFDKTPEALAEFKGTMAYSDLYKELCTNAELAANFVAQVIPQTIDKEEINKIVGEAMNKNVAAFSNV